MNSTARFSGRLSLVATLLLAVTACDVGGPDFEVEAPPPKIPAFLVSTGPGLNADGLKERVQLSSGIKVWEKGALELRFDRYLDPSTTIRQSYCLSSDTTNPTSLGECNGVPTSPAYDPVSRALVIYLNEDLKSGTQYRLTLFSPPADTTADPLTKGLRAFDGVPLERTLTFVFDTGFIPMGTEREQPPAAFTDCKPVQQAFGGCTSCHTNRDNTTGLTPPMGLNLQLAALPASINRVAVQTQHGGDATTPSTSVRNFGTNMPLIAPQAPGNSYLLYKALALEGYDPENLAEGETERLRNFITGYPMPAVEPASGPLDVVQNAERMLLISRWIAAGATCPTPDE